MCALAQRRGGERTVNSKDRNHRPRIHHSASTYDLEGMAFSQGGHLMSNKKCKPLEGSFKRMKKGYEEIHILVPKQKPTDDAGLWY